MESSHPKPAPEELLLSAKINIKEDGTNSITFNPAEPPQEHLVMLVLSYAAKVRWLLNTEPDEVRDLFKVMMVELLEGWEDGSGEVLLNKMPMVNKISVDLQGFNFTVPGGEEFTVYLGQKETKFFYVMNYLPQPGQSVNLVWQYGMLVSEIHRRLNDREKKIALCALKVLKDVFESEAADGESTELLMELTQVSNTAYEQGVKEVG